MDLQWCIPIQEQDFPGRIISSVLLELRRSSTPGEFSAEAAPAGSQSREECSGALLAPNWFFPHVISSDEIAPQEILLLEESWAKAHTDWRHFKKVLYENNLKIKHKPNPENFKLRIYTMKLSSSFLNLVRLSL
jgi:hypothetical protein